MGDGRRSEHDTGDRRLLRAGDLERLVAHLRAEHGEVIGPVVADGAIRLRPIASADDLPVGVTDDQDAARYRLVPTGSALRFSYAVGPDSLKAVVHPPRSPVWTIRRSDGTLTVEPVRPEATTRAVIGVRACDLHALAVLARTQTGGTHVDPAFRTRHAGLFLVAVDCAHPAPTCFCDTAGHGRVAAAGYDLALTELADGTGGACHVVRVGSAAGRAVVEALALEPAAAEVIEQAARTLDDEPQPQPQPQPQVRRLSDDAAALVVQTEHPHWDDVAQRCLTCGNCTAVCPTCFCTDMDDTVSLDGASATRTRVWDTCFSMEYSHLGPGPHRASPMSRYRQWLSHKLGTWHDHYGESGCVGCGRCITWCPVGIDLTAEVDALRAPAGSAP
ncbi:MAG: 4Fe-4S dicluster domain-containing protein [Acidimicrobiales bacterium]